MARRAARIDRNQPEIVEALRKAGASVTLLHAVGDGCPDLLVGYRNQTILMEIKDGQKPPSERNLTPDQQHWHGNWRGGVLVVATDVEGALRALWTLEALERGTRP